MTNEEIKMLLNSRLEKKASYSLAGRHGKHSELLSYIPLTAGAEFLAQGGLRGALDIGYTKDNINMATTGGALLGAFELLPYLISKMTKKRTTSEQKQYEDSFATTLANLIPGISAYNRHKSAEYYDDLYRRMEKDTEKGAES